MKPEEMTLDQLVEESRDLLASINNWCDLAKEAGRRMDAIQNEMSRRKAAVESAMQEPPHAH